MTDKKLDENIQKHIVKLIIASILAALWTASIIVYQPFPAIINVISIACGLLVMMFAMAGWLITYAISTASDQLADIFEKL